MPTSRRRTIERELREIDLYLPEDSSGIDIEAVREYLGSLFPTVRVRIRPAVLSGFSGPRLEKCADDLASSRVKNPNSDIQPGTPMYGEVDYERRALRGTAKLGGVVYDGRKVEAICLCLLRRRMSTVRCSIVFTQRLLSTYSKDDLRHHLRTIVCGFPSLVSVPGVVEAPAKPKEYHILRQQLEAAGAGPIELMKLKSAFKSSFIDYGDPSVNEVLKGLALQAVIFHLTLDPFCDEKTCRLFNAHWQEDLIRSQVTSAKFCSGHARAIRRLARKPVLEW